MDVINPRMQSDDTSNNEKRSSPLRIPTEDYEPYILDNLPPCGYSSLERRISGNKSKRGILPFVFANKSKN